MKARLSGVLSEQAAKLYEHLLVSGTLALTDHPDLPTSPAGRELIDKGFARMRHVDGSALVPVEPERAVDNAILVLQRQIFEQYQTLLRLRDEMQSLQQTYMSYAASHEKPHEFVRLLTDRTEISALAAELALSAQREVASIETEHFGRTPDPRAARVPAADVVARGVRFRNICTPAVLEMPGADEMLKRSAEGGWESRVCPGMPMKMVMVDERAALLPLDPTGMEGAMLVRAPVIVEALRMYFELLWSRAVPVGGDGGTDLPRQQEQVLRLVLTGMTDGAIARHIGISERTVRRQVGALLERLGVTNRVSLAVTAVREGWVD
jgi:DNA-binding CsgD family transcriptional regulator